MEDKMTTNEIGALLGLSAPTIRSLQRLGIIGKTGRTFEVAGTVRAYLAHLRRAQRAPADRTTAAIRKLAAVSDVIVFPVEKIDGVGLVQTSMVGTLVRRSRRRASPRI